MKPQSWDNEYNKPWETPELGQGALQKPGKPQTDNTIKTSESPDHRTEGITKACETLELGQRVPYKKLGNPKPRTKSTIMTWETQSL